MRKVARFLICVMLSLFMVSAIPSLNKNAAAVSQDKLVSYVDFSAEINGVLAEYIKFNDRKPGSEDEKKAADYILNYMNDLSNVKPKNTAYIKDGVQNFTFESVHSGLYENSQNIIFEYKVAEKNAKNVILACNYDAIAYKLGKDGFYKPTKTEGLNTSAGSVATLLALAKHLPYSSIDFNIEFVFFGAGESLNAGADIYVQGISSKEKENILCMVNFENIALGKNLYFYVDEVETEFSKLVEKVAVKNKLDIDEVNVRNLNKINIGEPGELGLGYTHIAIEAENAKFMKAGIPALNVFAGEYEGGMIVGRNEFLGKDAVAYTKNDTVEYITEKFGFENVTENLYETYKSMSQLLTDEDFEKVLSKAAGETAWLYNIFANGKLVAYLTLCALIVFVVVAMFVHYKLSIKAYHANVEVEFLSSVVKISEQIDQTGIDPSVPKVVSQVVAHDIKKDKIIKRRRKKDK